MPPTNVPSEEKRESTEDDATVPAPRWVKIVIAVGIVLVLAFIAKHLVGGGFRGHGN